VEAAWPSETLISYHIIQYHNPEEYNLDHLHVLINYHKAHQISFTAIHIASMDPVGFFVHDLLCNLCNGTWFKHWLGVFLTGGYTNFPLSFLENAKISSEGHISSYIPPDPALVTCISYGMQLKPTHWCCIFQEFLSCY
jgi:hypothetical protein